MSNIFEQAESNKHFESVAKSLNIIAEHFTTELISVDELVKWLEDNKRCTLTADGLAAKLVGTFDIRRGQ